MALEKDYQASPPFRQIWWELAGAEVKSCLLLNLPSCLPREPTVTPPSKQQLPVNVRQLYKIELETTTTLLEACHVPSPFDEYDDCLAKLVRSLAALEKTQENVKQVPENISRAENLRLEVLLFSLVLRGRIWSRGAAKALEIAREIKTICGDKASKQECWPRGFAVGLAEDTLSRSAPWAPMAPPFPTPPTANGYSTIAPNLDCGVNYPGLDAMPNANSVVLDQSLGVQPLQQQYVDLAQSGAPSDSTSFHQTAYVPSYSGAAADDHYSIVPYYAPPIIPEAQPVAWPAFTGSCPDSNAGSYTDTNVGSNTDLTIGPFTDPNIGSYPGWPWPAVPATNMLDAVNGAQFLDIHEFMLPSIADTDLAFTGREMEATDAQSVRQTNAWIFRVDEVEM
ncbi:hypothetical protein AYO21_10180 [Fonsecaea monophora]|uniref:Transcription factor domain-containing protein n=1 Tax=Fonsecaea monophora TaxID=254056 RepID=A0A177EWH7_9EURO|nr:hypothetical protein AYO21_10180 [Fonsecaea monophora]KAH0829870.1 hypothetical protein FOPE_10481 [Fonsecaea pedrosoi]OAG35640.1 hypothetical protein AYO21_10180 [Fonsecaea monophora]